MLVAAADVSEDKDILVVVVNGVDDGNSDNVVVAGIAEVVEAVSLVFVDALPVADRLRVFGLSTSTSFSSLIQSSIEMIALEEDDEEEEDGDDGGLLLLATVK